jgi:DHA2 family multidrug resistance protein
VTAAAPTFEAPAVTAPAPVNKWLVTVSIAFGSLMASIDSSIVNVALPQIRGAVGATIEEITWVSTAYIIATVLVMPLTGFLGTFFGQKRVYLASLVLFVLGSALCGLAHSLPTLVLFRAIQGFGAGALQPTQQAILRQTFPPKEQGMAMAMFAMVIMVGPAVGPTLGGYIVDNYSWQWIFYINLPIGAIGTFMTWRYVIEPPDVTGLSALAAVSLGAFIIRELTAVAPVVNLRLFRDKTFASGTAIGGVMFAMLMGSMFLLPVFMQELLGFDATQSGTTLMPRTLAMMFVTPIIGRIYNHVPPAIIVAIGGVFFALGSYQLSHITLMSSSTDIVIPLLVTGVGFACLFIPLTTAALTFIPRPQLADAAGLNSFVRQIGGSFGLTVFATMLSNYGKRATASVGWHVTSLRPEVVARADAMAANFQAHGMGAVDAKQTALRALAGAVARQGTVLAFEKTFLLQGIIFLAVLPLLFFLRVGRGPKAEHIEMTME